VDATIIRSTAHIQGKDSVTTSITPAGRKVSVTKLTVTSTATTEDVIYLTITAVGSSRLFVNVTPTHPGRMTAVHVDCFMVSYTLVLATTNPKTARSHCSSPVMASAMRIRLKSQRRPLAAPCREKPSTVKTTTCVISPLLNVHPNFI